MSTPPIDTAPIAATIVASSDAYNDLTWFLEHSGRYYRVRPGWVIRTLIRLHSDGHGRQLSELEG